MQHSWIVTEVEPLACSSGSYLCNSLVPLRRFSSLVTCTTQLHNGAIRKVAVIHFTEVSTNAFIGHLFT